MCFLAVRFFLCSIFISLLVACSNDPELQSFASDGCSLFPDQSLITSEDWCSCCFEHDLAYWRGGTFEQRKTADLRLKKCVFDKTNNEVLANLMYEGVRFGGSPYFYNWYRWGYGWDYDRKYQALTIDEVSLADDLLKEYYANKRQNVCIRNL